MISGVGLIPVWRNPLTCAKLAIIATAKIKTPNGSNRFFPAGYLCLSLCLPIAILVPRIIRVDRKSNALSMKDATSEILDEDRTARPFETRRMKLIAKLTAGTCQYRYLSESRTISPFSANFASFSLFSSLC
jgi:hypothetical protein